MSLQAGNHKARVVGSSVTEDKKGQPLVVLEFEIEGDAGQVEKLKKRLSFSGGAKEVSIKILHDCGFFGPDLSSLDGTECFKEVEVEVVLDWEHYEGKDYLNIKYINGKGGSKPALTKAQIKEKFGPYPIAPGLKEPEIPF